MSVFIVKKFRLLRCGQLSWVSAHQGRGEPVAMQLDGPRPQPGRPQKARPPRADRVGPLLVDQANGEDAVMDFEAYFQ